MILFTVEQAVACANRCAEFGDIPCWDVDEGCYPCAECVAQAGEAGTAGTTEIGPVHEHAVPEGNAP